MRIAIIAHSAFAGEFSVEPDLVVSYLFTGKRRVLSCFVADSIGEGAGGGYHRAHTLCFK